MAIPATAQPRSESHNPRRFYRADIDGLRGIAVLAVVGFHAFPGWFGSGFVGVDVFFVLSGYLISGIILSELARGRFTYRHFYERRILRIFPALALVLAASLLIGWLELFPDEFTSLGRQTFGGAAFWANIVLWQQTGYFDQAANIKPLLHLWSLGVEEQFYFVWPLTLALVWRSRHRIAVILALLGASFVLNAAFVAGHPDATFFLPVTRFWELLLGVVVAASAANTHASQSGEAISPALSRANLLAWIGAGLMVLAFTVVDASRPFPGWWGLLPTLGSTALVAAGPDAWLNRTLLSSRWLVAVGLISYPLYLWHWPLLAFANVLQPDGVALLPRAALVVASILLATLTYQYIERPIRFGRRRPVTVPGLCILVASLCLAGWLSGAGRVAPRAARGEFQKVWDAVADWHPFENGFVTTRLGGIEVHLLGDPKDRVLFLGDSNVEQFGPRMSLLYAAAPDRTSPILVAVYGGCPPIPNVREKNHPDCPGFLTNALRLAGDDSVQRIVVGACWNCYFRQSRRPDERFRVLRGREWPAAVSQRRPGERHRGSR